VYRRKNRPNVTLIRAFLQHPVFPVIVEVSAHHFGMVPDLDMFLILVAQRFLIALLGEEQPHTLAFPSHGGVTGKHVKDDHVPGIRVETLQAHNVMARQFLRTGFLPCLCKLLPDGSGLIRQMVVLLDVTHHRHTFISREGTEFG
jgi:hypothetical protein